MYEMYEVKLTKFGAPVYVFVTVYRNHGGLLKAESFCSFPEPNSSPIAKRLKAEFRELDAEPFDFDENTMLQLVRDESEHIINQHIDKYFDNKEWMLNSDSINFKEIDVSRLIRMRLRGMGGFLVDIANETECNELEDALRQVIRFRAVTSQPIPLE